jgi:Spy/CpxP family protein refolding chaperone
MKTTLRVLIVAALTAGLGSATWMATTVAQEAAPAADSSDPAGPRVGDDEAGRLPPGYTVVVTKEQRAKIYEIQEKYVSQLEALQRQIAELEGKRDQEIAGLLDAEQKTILAYVLKVRERDRKKEAPIANTGN